MRTKIIDDHGRLWELGTGHTQGREANRYGRIRLLVRTRGFISLSQRRGDVVVSFRPANVSPIALASLFYWLADNPCDRIGLSIVTSGDAALYELYGSERIAKRRICELIDQEDRGIHRHFKSRSGSLDRLPPGSGFAVLFDHWRATGGVFVKDECLRLLNRHAAGRFILLEARPDGRGFVVIEAGPGLLIPDRPSHQALVGSQFEDIPDYPYGKWVSENYRSVLKSQQPDFSHIDAWIFWPRTGRVRRFYSRLILPFRSGRRRLLLGISGMPADLDFGIEAA